MHGGVGGAEPRGSPLSRSHLHRPWRPISGRARDCIDKFLAEGNAVVDALATAVNQRLFRDEAR